MTYHLAYILDGQEQPVPADILVSSDWCQANPERLQVGLTRVTRPRGVLDVSTVFLYGINHAHDEGPPILWETMVFGLDDEDEVQERYASHEDAVARHTRHVAIAEAGTYDDRVRRGQP